MAAEDTFPDTIETLPVKDDRLNPRVPLQFIGEFHAKDGTILPQYAITKASHPELVAALNTYLVNAGIRKQYEIVMVGDGSGQQKWGGIYRNGKLRIGDGLFSHGSLEMLKHFIGHEIGHDWKENYPLATSPVPESSPHPPHYKTEIEADLIGICLTQDKEGGIQMMTSPDLRPAWLTDTRPLEARKEAMQDFDLSRCREWVDWSPGESVAPTTPQDGSPLPPKRTR